ncbi:MAG: aspartate aminotransferase family protein [Clostridia bacterium]|nr:aspartate aminotransferase family protein [Clostridia bacterium]
MIMDIKILDKENVANTYGREDVVFTSGKGSTLIDSDGREYIDFGSGIAVNSLGIADDKWVDAVTAQLKKIAHTSNLYHNEPCAILAQKLTGRTGLKKVFFSNSGAEANEFAIKCARKYSYDKYGEGRYGIITLKNSFHGRTMATITATGQDVFHTYFNPFLEGFSYAEAGNIEDLISKANDKTCAVMLEFVQGEGGVIALDKEYVKQVFDLCKKNDWLFIADEVQTGNGRTGTLYAFEQYGVVPDIMSTAKGLAGGLPMGATLVGEKCEYVMSAGTHGSTFGGNPAVSAGAIEVLDRITPEFLQNVQSKSKKIIDFLKNTKGVESVSGLGLMLGVKTVKDAKLVKAECLKNGLVVLTAKDKIRLLPALNISDEDIEKGLKILEKALV